MDRDFLLFTCLALYNIHLPSVILLNVLCLAHIKNKYMPCSSQTCLEIARKDKS